MQVINLELVHNYINGLDTAPYDISELEDNPSFMKVVLLATKDPKMYEFCSEKVKTDYDFVISMLENFSNDFEFAKVVAGNYLNSLKVNPLSTDVSEENLSNRMKAMEVNILVDSIKSDINIFSVQARVIAAEEIERVQSIAKHNKDKFGNDLGLGFIFILEQYGSSKIITDYLAKCMARRVFCYGSDDGETLTRLVHRRCHSFSEIERMGVNNFIFSELYSRDSFLAAHINANPSLISQIKDDIMAVGRTWDSYMNRLNQERINIFNEDVLRFLDEDMDTVEVNMNDLEKYVAVKTGHEDVFKKYDPAYNEDADISYLIHTTDFDLARAKKFACSVAERLFATDVIDRTRDDYDGYDDRKRKTTANFKFKIGSK